MKLIEYLKEVYGYDTPIILKDIRIGGKSKSAIRQELYRETKLGNIQSYGNGVYYFKNSINKFSFLPDPSLTFDEVVKEKYISKKTNPDLYIYGYVTGQTFLNQIGISQQVPGKIEITTNNTSSKKRLICVTGRYAILRKARTEVNFMNYKILQFLDMFHFLSQDDLEINKDLLSNYIKGNKFSKVEFNRYIKLYSTRTIKMIFESGLIHDFR